MTAGRLLILLSAIMPGACAPASTGEGLSDPAPAAKLDAIRAAASAQDRTAVRGLVEQLDSDDPAVRMAAAEALRQLTGQTHGFVHDAPRPERLRAIRRWVAALDHDDRPAPAGDDRDDQDVARGGNR